MTPRTRTVEPAADLWSALCALRREKDPAALDLRYGDDPAWRLYRPIAARGAMHVLAQVGQSLDGRVATPTGDARDVSGPGGIRHLHRCRALVDAVVVGIGTVEADDPRLTVRMVEGPCPQRVVIDVDGRFPSACALLENGPPPIVIHAEDVRVAADVETIALPRGPAGLDVADIHSALQARGFASVLVEGGARTIARFLEADLVDRLHIAVAPILIGSGPQGINLSAIERLDAALRPRVEVYDLGSDTLFECRFARRSGR